MIKKLNFPPYGTQDEWINKINELVDTVNDITDWIKRTDETIVKYGIKPIENATISKMENVAENNQSAKIAQWFKNLQELALVRKALDKGIEHITGLNNMIESWYKLINSDLDQETKLHILKSAISAYVENKGGNNDNT